MVAEHPKPLWKRTLCLLFKIYCGVGTLWFTLCVGYIIWSFFDQESANGLPYHVTENDVMSSYGLYMKKEYPKRADFFWNLATRLGNFATITNVPEKDLFSYLGKPDLVVSGTNGFEFFIYYYNENSGSNLWEILATIKDGRLSQVGFNMASPKDLSVYKPYMADSATNSGFPPLQPK